MRIITELSRWAIPVFLLLVPLVAFIKRVKVYEEFVKGAEDGFWTAVKIIPFLVGMLVAIKVFIDSGAMELIAYALNPVFKFFGLREDLTQIIPLAIMRPLSGSGGLGMATQIIAQHGPDSFLGRLASTMQGSTDTTFFVLTIYFGSVGINKYRYALKVGLIADITGLIASIYIVNKVFG
ncbi:MAG TPA: spore maturation protein [Candidatus Deferrimicrobium sp.]|nr:spore maturation protein [Candidatus Deferrimicrobium sp.]